MTKDYKYNIGDIIYTNTGEIQILEQTKKYKKNNINYYKCYKYKCLKDGFISIIDEYHLNDKEGCSVCANKVVVKGINDIATTRPDMVKYFLNIEDAYKYTCSSNKKILAKCPDCGLEKITLINYISRKNFSCSSCSDKVSYPNKFMYNLLSQLDVDFETEKIFDWAKDKRYDFYVTTICCIIEVNGMQHYEIASKNSKYKHTLLEEQENDKLKERLAKENNVKNYIVIDCRKSNMDFIKNSILNNEFVNLFDVSKIDWDKCDKNNNLIKVACDYWNNGIESTIEISLIMKISRGNITNYLKKGAKLGWCNYNPKEEMQKSAIKNGKVNRKQIICLDNEQIFDSIAQCSRKSEEIFGVKLTKQGISRVCKGGRKHHRNLSFMFYEDYIKLPY